MLFDKLIIIMIGVKRIIAIGFEAGKLGDREAKRLKTQNAKAKGVKS